MIQQRELKRGDGISQLKACKIAASARGPDAERQALARRWEGRGQAGPGRRGSHMRWNHRARALRPNDPPPGTYPTATLSHAHTARFVRAKDSIDLSVSQQETLR